MTTSMCFWEMQLPMPLLVNLQSTKWIKWTSGEEAAPEKRKLYSSSQSPSPPFCPDMLLKYIKVDMGVSSMLLLAVVNSVVVFFPPLLWLQGIWTNCSLWSTWMASFETLDFKPLPPPEQKSLILFESVLVFWVCTAVPGFLSWRQISWGELFFRSCHVHTGRVGKSCLRSSFLTTTKRNWAHWGG